MFDLLNNRLDQPSPMSYDRPVFGIVGHYIAQHRISGPPQELRRRATASEIANPVNQVSSAPKLFDPTRDLPAGFLEFFLPLHSIFTPWQQKLAYQRIEVLEAALEGEKPAHSFPYDTVRNGWRLELTVWCQDLRYHMTSPDDDALLCVKILNSCASDVMQYL